MKIFVDLARDVYTKKHVNYSKIKGKYGIISVLTYMNSRKKLLMRLYV